MKKFLSLSFVLLIICTKQYAQSAKQCFQPGDKVCFIGNSITQMGHYHYFVNLYYMLHYPEMQLETYNCGISGNMGFNVLKRIQRDILVHKPTVATLMLGMNDVNRELYEKVTTDTAILNARDRSIELYRKNVDSIAQQLTKNHCRLIFLTPSIYDQESKIEATNNYGVNDALGICAKFLKTLAPKYNAQVVDFNGEMNKINHLGLAMDQNFALAGNDRIHPDIWGHFIMASIFLKTLEMPSFVSKIEIDFANQKVTSSQNCEISGLKSEKSKLTFQCVEK